MSIWDQAPIVEVFTPRCPTCGSLDFTPIRSVRDTDGVSTRRMMCKECSQPFVVIVSPIPLLEIGKWTLGAAILPSDPRPFGG